MLVRLTCEGETLHETTIEQMPSSLTIGRSARCEWALPPRFREVSGTHARLTLCDGRITIQDLDSKNGLHYRGSRIVTRELAPGDAIVIGECRLEVIAAPGGKCAGRSPALVGCSEGIWDRRVPLTAETFTIGRSRDASWSIADPNVSERHAEISLGDDGVYRIKDCRSQNGTFLNGRRLPPEQPVALRAGDGLEFVYWAVRFDDGKAASPEKIVVRAGLAAIAGLLAVSVALAIFRPPTAQRPGSAHVDALRALFAEDRIADARGRFEALGQAGDVPAGFHDDVRKALSLDEALQGCEGALKRDHEPLTDEQSLEKLRGALLQTSGAEYGLDIARLRKRAREAHDELSGRIAGGYMAAMDAAVREAGVGDSPESRKTWLNRVCDPDCFTNSVEIRSFLDEELAGMRVLTPPGNAASDIASTAGILEQARRLRQFLNGCGSLAPPNTEVARAAETSWADAEREVFERLCGEIETRRKDRDNRKALLAAAIAVKLAPELARDISKGSVEGRSVKEWASQAWKKGGVVP